MCGIYLGMILAERKLRFGYKKETLQLIANFSGWQRLETRQRVVEEITRNIRAYKLGESLNVVN